MAPSMSSEMFMIGVREVGDVLCGDVYDRIGVGHVGDVRDAYGMRGMNDSGRRRRLRRIRDEWARIFQW